mmetsp:Transcript_119347/g.337629  ORF Transcript_119347/g.337629 Transcript_119347/m.337629 type:complete len:240 (-) Transcript_119347:35-754(-)
MAVPFLGWTTRPLRVAREQTVVLPLAVTLAQSAADSSLLSETVAPPTPSARQVSASSASASAARSTFALGKAVPPPEPKGMSERYINTVTIRLAPPPRGSKFVFGFLKATCSCSGTKKSVWVTYFSPVLYRRTWMASKSSRFSLDTRVTAMARAMMRFATIDDLSQNVLLVRSSRMLTEPAMPAMERWNLSAAFPSSLSHSSELKKFSTLKSLGSRESKVKRTGPPCADGGSTPDGSKV